MNEKRNLENELNDLINRKAAGAQIRSRANWIENGEKNSAYFLGLEKNRQYKNNIKQLFNEKNKIVHEDEDILKNMCNFYEKLYSNMEDNRYCEMNEYLQNTKFENVLSNEDKNMLDQFPTLDECTCAVFDMKENKSPGLDGIPSEFYKKFWKELKDHFYSCMRYSYEKESLTSSQRLSVITLLYKKGDKRQLNNYRPISLTNTDYKIIAFVLAKRLQRILDNIISKDQSAYIKGRYIGINARLIVDIFEYCESNNQEAILLFLDFQKAFDSVEWPFMLKTLEFFNFGHEFVKWIQILYKNPVFRLKNNNWLSKTCVMKRGIRQGCPISAIIFLFVAEVLSIRIRQNEEIHGFKKKGMKNEVKTLQHADDCTLPLKNIRSVKSAIREIDIFSKFSGMKLNLSKTECILLGSLKGKYADIDGIAVNDTCVKVLGIHIGHDKESCYKNNWTKKIDEIQKLF